MGAPDAPYPSDGEAPVRRVWLDPYSIADKAVSNEDFRKFVNDTGYLTYAEQIGHSYVFHLLATRDAPILEKHHSALTPWWLAVIGACWHSPYGPGSDVDDITQHPVVHISWEDAVAYCQWAHARLPTEAEWEHAARAGRTGEPFPWGNELELNGLHHANTWQGDFPKTNSAVDGYIGTAPVGAYSPNAFGLYNMVGNVWEWTADRFTALHSPRQAINPKGPLNGDKRVTKGGSYLCHESYCKRYRTSSRQGLINQTSAGNVGFRVAGVP